MVVWYKDQNSYNNIPALHKISAVYKTLNTD